MTTEKAPETLCRKPSLTKLTASCTLSIIVGVIVFASAVAFIVFDDSVPNGNNLKDFVVYKPLVLPENEMQLDEMAQHLEIDLDAPNAIEPAAGDSVDLLPEEEKPVTPVISP